MRSTTSVHWNTGQISIEHNTREKELCSHEGHIDLLNEHGSSFHEVLIHKDLRDAYEEYFGEAIEEYNAKQKRKDRRLSVEDYMKSIENDTRGKKQTKKKNGKRVVNEDATREGKQTSYEFTVRVGNTTKKKDKDDKVIYDKNNHHVREEEFPRELQCAILQKYYETFQENNPNLLLVSVNRHGDEGFYNHRKVWEYGTVHDHYEIIPVATGFKQGLSIQNSMNKAMASMGFKGSDCYSEWAKKEQARLDKITQQEYTKYCKNHPDFAKSHGELTIYHPVSEKSKKGDKTKEQFVAEQELDELIHEAESWKVRYRKLSDDVNKERKDVEREKKKNEEREKEIAEAEEQFKSVIGGLTGYEYGEDYDDLPDLLNDLKTWADKVRGKVEKIDAIYSRANEYLYMIKDFYRKEQSWMGDLAKERIMTVEKEEEELKKEMESARTSTATDRILESLVDLCENLESVTEELGEQYGY